MPVSKKQLEGYRFQNRGRVILYISHPVWAHWIPPIVEKASKYGVTALSFVTPSFKDLMTYLCHETRTFDVIVFVPGHGCEPLIEQRVKKRKKDGPKTEMVQAAPGIVRSGDPLSRRRDELIRGPSLKKFVNACLELTVHLHICTCHQGCMIRLYNDMVDPKHHAKMYILSGWTMAMMTEDQDVDKFMYEGCHHYGKRKPGKLFVSVYHPSSV